MKEKLLKDLGLTDGEIRIYLALLNLGISTTGKIIDKSHITSSKVYVILEKLEQKGFVSHIIKNNRKHFQATNPTKILEYIENKQKYLNEKYNQAKNMLPQFLSEYNKIHEKKETTMYQGLKGIQSAMFDFIANLKENDEYLVLGTGKPLDKNTQLLVRNFYLKKAQKGIKTRLIYNKEYHSIKKLYKNIPDTQIRFINNITPSTIAISKTKTLIITYDEEKIAVLINSKQISNSFKAFFESMWTIAKE